MFVDTFPEFVARHGEERYYAQGIEWFADGAIRTDMGMYEPPTDPVQLNRNKHSFLSAKLEAEISAFNNFRSHCMNQAMYRPGTVPPPPADAEQQLLAGKARIEVLRDQIAELERERDEMPDMVARRHKEQRDYAMRQEQQREAERLRHITI